MENTWPNQADAISKGWAKSEAKGYFLCRLKRTGDKFRLDFLDESSIEKLIRQKMLVGRIDQSLNESTDPPTLGRKDIIVSTESDELREFFSTSNHDKLFTTSGLTFVRQRDQPELFTTTGVMFSKANDLPTNVILSGMIKLTGRVNCEPSLRWNAFPTDNALNGIDAHAS